MELCSVCKKEKEAIFYQKDQTTICGDCILNLPGHPMFCYACGQYLGEKGELTEAVYLLDVQHYDQGKNIIEMTYCGKCTLKMPDRSLKMLQRIKDRVIVK